jgi:hypothetical protein
MPPNNHAARLREMAEYESSKAEEWHRQSTMMWPTCGYSNAACARARQVSEQSAAALLAGAEALEAIERAEKCLDGISVTAVKCFDRAAEVADLAEWVLAAMEGEKEKSDG